MTVMIFCFIYQAKWSFTNSCFTLAARILSPFLKYVAQFAEMKINENKTNPSALTALQQEFFFVKM